MTVFCSTYLFVIYKDYHAGIETLTDAQINMLEKLRFDPCPSVGTFLEAGRRRRSPLDWSCDKSPFPKLFDRGFTTHEHLDIFGLINMNGRLYDPWLGRMLSPDPFVQAPGSTQNYNRYSYAHNNPLKYTDPDGEWAQFLFAAIAGGVMNMVMNGNNIKTGWDALKYFGIGAAAGVLSAGVGIGAAGAIGGSGFFAGAVVGGTAGATNGVVTAFGNTIVAGGGVDAAISNGARMGMIQGATGALMGGLIGGLMANSQESNFWTGEYKILESKGNGNYRYQQSLKNAKSYNDSFSQKVDTEALRGEIKDKFDVEIGDLNLSDITTDSGKYGMTGGSNNYYVNPKGNVVNGFFDPNTLSLHVSPGILYGDATHFTATGGHELIHALHFYIFGDSFNMNFSESVAHHYSGDVLVENGYYFGGNKYYQSGNTFYKYMNVPYQYYFNAPSFWP